MINLTDFKVSNYPDGHKHIVSDLLLCGEDTLAASIRSFDDLFLIAQIKEIHPELTRLRVNYLLGARCDRNFSAGEALDLRIVCDFINHLEFEVVEVLKPHSYRTLALLKRAIEIDVTKQLIFGALQGEKIYGKTYYVSPDKGASRWIHDLNIGPIIQCDKTRDPMDPHGKIQKITLQCPDDGVNFIIVDDLCDGGGTFLEIARQLRESVPPHWRTYKKLKIFLVVTHAIFSKGFQPFEGLIDRIYCTNSFKDVEHPLVRQLKI